MTLHVYNTLGREKQEFVPLNPPRVGVYVCGPTVYGHAHLGHGKTYVNFDVIVRYLRYLGYDVTYVQNITDVGHLTDDTHGMADEGEDKIIAEARRRKLHPMAVVEAFKRSYFEDMDALNVLRPDISPHASAHIPEQIELIETLIGKGNAYAVDGKVFFDISSFPEYGKLSNRRVDEMLGGARVSVDADKRHEGDFYLWRPAAPEHILQWPSPWGRGYPGWHLECSVMSMKYLGKTVDIHGGGLENQFPHHECEIAQSEAANACLFVKYWLHNGMLTVDGTKMGKSLGNFITLKQVFSGDHPRLTKAYDPLVVRQFILGGHYRGQIDFSNDALAAAESGARRLREAVLAVREAASHAPAGPARDAIRQMLDEAKARFEEAMNDDFNTAAAMSALFDLVRQTNTLLTAGITRDAAAEIDAVFRRLGGNVLGLVLDRYPEEGAGGGELLTPVMQVLIDLRNEARKAKNFQLADDIRKRLNAAGIALEDRPDGTIWRRA
jgi:cysteinyl-tRNA synthetase